MIYLKYEAKTISVINVQVRCTKKVIKSGTKIDNLVWNKVDEKNTRYKSTGLEFHLIQSTTGKWRSLFQSEVESNGNADFIEDENVRLFASLWPYAYTGKSLDIKVGYLFRKNK